MQRVHIIVIGVAAVIVAAVYFLFFSGSAEKSPHPAPQVRQPSSLRPAPTIDEASRSAIRANYKAVLGTLATYAVAQDMFKKAGLGAVVGNNPPGLEAAYCDNFRNLYYGSAGGVGEDDAPLDFLPREVADAFAGGASGNATRRNPSETAAPYAGYLFLDDPGVTDWAENCGLVAYPARYGQTGTLIFWVDTQANVLAMDPMSEAGKTPPLITASDSPLHREGAKKWRPLTWAESRNME